MAKVIHGDDWNDIHDTGGICTTALVSMNVVGGVLVFKIPSMLLRPPPAICIWRFCSYLYGFSTNTAITITTYLFLP
ncbi:putative purine permease [Arachis hypogaea]|nr:putative purine permease [Arachis hypogaea]